MNEKGYRPFVSILRKLGFIREEQALEVEDLLNERANADPDQTTMDIVVSAGIVDESQVDKIQRVREQEDRNGYRIDTLKLAQRATQSSKKSSDMLGEVAAAIAEKKIDPR